MEPDIALPGGEPSTEETLGETGLSALRKLRSECRGLRLRLRECEAKRAPLPGVRVRSWRPVGDHRSELAGFADVEIAGLVILDMRLLRAHGGYVLSWPQRMPRNTGRLVPLVIPSPDLDAQVLAAILVAAHPERVEP